MSTDTPPLVLTFGISDPTGASGIQSDLLTLASMGCHGLTVLTGYAVRDSADEGEVVGLAAEAVAAQARMLLEDMPVCAFKIGAAVSAETVAAIAEIVADYDDVPLILTPDFSLDEDHAHAGEELREALAQLLAAQTTLLVTDPFALALLAQPDADAEAPSPARAMAHLFASGCEYILLTQGGPQHLTLGLHNEEGPVREDEWARPANRVLGLTDTLATAIAALLGTGLDPESAVREAQEYLFQANRAAFRPGMGGWLQDRMFWTRDENGTVVRPSPAHAVTSEILARGGASQH